MNPIQRLEYILGQSRPHGSATELKFGSWVVQQTNGMMDAFGNIHRLVGDSDTLFSCHIDTMTRFSGTQEIELYDNMYELKNPKPGQCLGADCGAGVWLMIEMIRAEVPGHYIFHRGEEVGGLGSKWIARHAPPTAKRAIAFDRKGTRDVITHQFNGRCCSDRFARALSKQLPGYRPNAGGVFTDTANYIRLIPECTNISVGYANEHGPRETLDQNHILTLLTDLVVLPWETLVTERTLEYATPA